MSAESFLVNSMEVPVDTNIDSEEKTDGTAGDRTSDQVDDVKDPLLQIKIVEVQSAGCDGEKDIAVNELGAVNKLDEGLTDEVGYNSTESDDSKTNIEYTHPVALRRSSDQTSCNDTKIPLTCPQNVTTLNDVTSIIELKKLWAKSIKSESRCSLSAAKSPRRNSNGSSLMTGLKNDTHTTHEEKKFEKKFSVGDSDSILSHSGNDEDFYPDTRRRKKMKVINDESKVAVTKEACLKSVCEHQEKKKKRIGRPPILGNYHCKLCPFTVNERSLLQKHYDEMHKTVTPCLLCNKKYKTWYGYFEHMALKHDAKKIFRCQFEGCTYSSKSRTCLSKHKAIHDLDLKQSCHKTKRIQPTNIQCAVKNDLDKRCIHSHSDDKPFQCVICGFRVRTNSELKSHFLFHSEERPFKCSFPGCTVAKKTNTDLRKHQKVHKK